jgi:aromatic ring hydroxylase
MIRTKEEYRDKLFNMRPNIYIGGKAVNRDDSRLRPGIRVMDQTFDLARQSKFDDLFTAASFMTGEKINRWAHLPQNPRDLILKQKMIRVGARRVGGCIQRCMGQDALNALAVCTQEIDAAKGSDYHERFRQYLSWYHRNDINGCCAQTDSKGDRLKRPHEQLDPNAYVHIVEENEDGIFVSGYKMSITQAAYADELFVLPTRALQDEDRAFAVAFAIPADADGVRLVTRPVWMRDKDDPDAAPFDRYGVSDSVIIFDRAFVPKERIFMCGEWEFGRRLALLFADSHRHSYCGCKPAVSDILCGATLLAAEANNVAKVSHVKEKLAEFASAASLAYAAGVSAALFGEKTDSGVFFPNTVYANVGRRLTGELIYHEYNLLVEVAGGIAATLPFHEDFKVGENVAYLEQFIRRNPNISSDDAIKIWKFIENLSSSPMAAWYKVAGVHGGGSPIMETIALNIEYDFEDKKNLARYLAGISADLDDSTILNMNPIFDVDSV